MSDGGDDFARSNGDILPGENHALVRHRPPGRAVSTEVMSNALAPAALPARSLPPMLISPQVIEEFVAFLIGRLDDRFCQVAFVERCFFSILCVYYIIIVQVNAH